jgi:hypothetical protein
MFAFHWTYVTVKMFQVSGLNVINILCILNIAILWKTSRFEKNDIKVWFQINVEAGVIEQIWNTKFGPWVSVYIPSVSKVIEIRSVILRSFYALYLWLYSPLLILGRFFSVLILYIVRMTLWMRDRPVARPLPTHRTTHTNIHALSGIRTHDPSIRGSVDSLFVRLRGHCDLLVLCITYTTGAIIHIGNDPATENILQIEFVKVNWYVNWKGTIYCFFILSVYRLNH